MKRVAGTVALALFMWNPASAGELVFANGTRLAGELSNEALMVSTGSGLVDIVPEEIVVLSRGEVRLRDGRVIRGTLVGGLIKARTALGEIAIRVDELEAYRGAPAWAETAPGASGATAAPQPPAPASTAGAGVMSGLPTIASYQDPAHASRQASTGVGSGPGVKQAVLTNALTLASPSRLEVVGDAVLYRDAMFGSSQVASVTRGQQVTYVDSIDRRLRILNRLVFDGGYWVKVRLTDGLEGWIPAESVRELR